MELASNVELRKLYSEVTHELVGRRRSIDSRLGALDAASPRAGFEASRLYRDLVASIRQVDNVYTFLLEEGASDDDMELVQSLADYFLGAKDELDGVLGSEAGEIGARMGA